MNREKSLEVIFFQKILKTRNKYVTKKLETRIQKLQQRKKSCIFKINCYTPTKNHRSYFNCHLVCKKTTEKQEDVIPPFETGLSKCLQY